MEMVEVCFQGAAKDTSLCCIKIESFVSKGGGVVVGNPREHWRTIETDMQKLIKKTWN